MGAWNRVDRGQEEGKGMDEKMTIFICITVLSCILLWLPHIGKKEYSQDDMLWALYVTGKEQRVRDNGPS